MDIRLLKQFVAVYEEQNISRAAERCCVSQPALSNAIRQLEDELDCLLFNRSKRGVIPTPEADQLYPMANRMVGELDSIPKLFKQTQHTGTLTIGMMPELPHRHVAELLSEIKAILPHEHLKIVRHEEECDVRLLLDVMKDDDELFLPVWREKYVFCLHRDHPLAKQETIVPADLDNQPFIICPPCEAHQRTLGLVGQQGFKTNVVASAATKNQVAMLLLAQVGVSFLPEGMAAEWPELVTRPFDGPSDYRQVGLAWSSNRTANPLLQQVLGQLKPQIM
ncbi:LysR family transcriptional regulator [Endozoicomonadaceae bacterium StTr2]